MDLLERDAALAALAEARGSAARGAGRVVFVTGEPGIGKTSLVNRFLAGEGAGTRVLFGTCDDLSIPRPLGPIRDLAGAVSPALADAIAAGAAPHEIQSLLLAELELPPRPTVLVLEDVHWADDATFDSITLLGRRIGSLPALLVLTFRAGEVPRGHPLHAALGAIPASDSVFLELAPLSEAAVRSLAGDCADDVYAATGGNPFFVTELLAARTGTVLPPSVANAVLGRVARLDEDSRRLVELVSVVPNRVRTSVLDAVLPGWSAAAEEPERRRLLEVDPAFVRFRHELARNAVATNVPAAARRRLHCEVMESLVAAQADPADIVHHAEQAGMDDVVARYALVAARRAAALGSNRGAYSHYRRASDFADRLPAPEQAMLQEELANAAYGVGRLEHAFPAIERAIEIHRALGDLTGVGRCTRVLSRLHWFAGEGDLARTRGLEAVAILEPLGESVELARAFSGCSQLAMLAQDIEKALMWGDRALELATRIGDDSTRVHALVNLGTVRMHLDPYGTSDLVEALALADSLGEREEATRALGNLTSTLFNWIRPEEAERYALQGLAYAQKHEIHNIASYIATTHAWLLLRRGEWCEAERVTRREIERGVTVSQLVAKTVLTELAVRRGDRDAEARLVDLAAQASRAGDLQRVAPVLELETEAALMNGGPMPVERFRKLVSDYRSHGGLTGWGAARVAAWAAVAGIDVEIDGGEDSPPLSAMARCDWAAAADAFGETGWPHERGLMLSLLDDEESLVEAIEIARGLGAGPLTRRVARKMRALGMNVPRGPREATRTNPAGLTSRQLEVLGLLAGGLSNAEIADRLVVSSRTAEHHVAAVLTKLGAGNRWDAARRASELGLAAAD